MNELPNNNLETNASRQKSLILMSLFIYCNLVIVFITAIIAITYESKSYVKRIYDRSLQSVVEVKAYTKGVGESFGSAVLMKSDGTLVTNAHVLPRCSY